MTFGINEERFSNTVAPATTKLSSEQLFCLRMMKWKMSDDVFAAILSVAIVIVIIGGGINWRNCTG